MSEQYYTLCNFLTIDFGENLHEYFFAWNQFLIIYFFKVKILNNKLTR